MDIFLLELTTNTVTQYVQEDAQMLTQQSMICGKYHRTLVTYLVTFMQGLGNLQEWDTMWMTCR